LPDVLAHLRAGFPVSELWVYFNHAAVSPVAGPVQSAVAEFLAEASRQGSIGFAGWLARRERARARAAALIGADPAEVAFTTSTSQGLLTVATGLRLEPGDQIVVVEDDFPANQIPWFRQRRRGVELIVVPRRDGRVSVESLLGAITPRTRVIALPWVLYDTGFRLDLPALAAGLAEVNAGRTPWAAQSSASAGLSTERGAPGSHPASDPDGGPDSGERARSVAGNGSFGGADPHRRVLLCVDAIQGLGAFPLDVHTAGIDFLSADSHKWMLGLEGIGIFFCRRELVAILDAPMTSWWSLAEPFARWTPESPLHADARRFEYACMPTACLYGLDAALGMLAEAGSERIGARVLELTGRLAAGLRERDWTVHSPMGASSPSRGERSGILSASHPRLPAAEVVARLEQRGVSVTARGPGVRFSPHGWNTSAEVDTLLERLP
jgi:cysteine desulfurase / selenocysteine lyase